MTPGERNVVKSLVAVAWADGRLESGEYAVIEGLLTGFDATEEEEAEMLAYARTRRTLPNDIPLTELTQEDRELLFSNAALLTHADGDQSPLEKKLLQDLASWLGFTRSEAQALLSAAMEGAGHMLGD